ncbi:MAG: hypothetical protein ACU0GG_04700 [Paracoccaceae bacterium]
MDRLSIFLTLPIGAVVVGALVIATFALGFYGWTSLAIAIAIGMLLCWPVSYLISRRIKRKDKGWHPPSPEERARQTLPEV